MIKNIIRCVKSDIIKIKRTQFILIHLLIPVLSSLLFSAYFNATRPNNINNVSAFLEAVAIAFPFIAGIIVAIIIQLEQNAGNFQSMLSILASKNTVYMGKIVFFILFASGSTIIGVSLFAVLYPIIPFSFYIKVISILIITIIPIYIILFMFGLSFGKSASIGVGIVGSLISALMLTGLGDRVWKFIPWAWGVRFVDFYFLKYIDYTTYSYLIREIRIGKMCAIIISVILFVYSLILFNFWEGTKGNE